ncbi:hypothetical protein [Mesorhizobium marinum]|uniref:Uncharacterized protein n=1 Tax=Mesorhizobium marinum TaxID=3228790 RepID=A0ABV3QXD0_9HYPH
MGLLPGHVATKNVSVSTGAHMFNDWLIFTDILSAPATPGSD